MERVTWALARLAAGTALTQGESRDAIAVLLDGGASHAAAAALLTAMRVKGETADEVEGAVHAVRERMIPWECGDREDLLLDTCGTGGDGAGTINISTAAAITAAACEFPVVKHGNRAASSVSGSSDVLAALGVEADTDLLVLDRCLTELRIAFLFAPRFHPGLRPLAPIRRQLPFRTVLNLVGPLCNPANPGYQLVGVPDVPTAELMAEVFSRQRYLRRAVVVTGSDGLDEVTLAGPTSIRVVEPARIERGEWFPRDFGLSQQGTDALRVRDAWDSAARIRRVFSGERGPVRDYLLANTAAALWVTGKVSIKDGVAMAAHAIDSGAAARLISRWSELAPVNTSNLHNASRSDADHLGEGTPPGRVAGASDKA
jgi:anthranilate phosphoribosyltransferase